MNDIKIRIDKALEKFNIEEKRRLIREIEAESAHPDFWKDHKTASSQKKELSLFQGGVQKAEHMLELVELGKQEEAEAILNDFERLLYFSGPYDASSAILALHSGQGGVEAMDWTNMLYRMYSRYFEKKGWSCQTLEETP